MVTRVLFVCLRNAGRSQMSAALFEQAAAGRHEAESAGTAPAEKVQPEVVEVMREAGVDLAPERPRQLTDELARRADVIVTMGCGDACPVFPGKRYLDWNLRDPADRPIAEIRTLRDEIAQRVAALVAALDGTLEHRERPAAENALGALVFFHGFYGAPDDFLGFMDKIDPERRYHAYLPRGPWPMGEGRRSWLNPDHTREAPSDLEPVFRWLDSLPFAREQTVYAGWSQGARVAYEAGLRDRRRPAAIVALGGRLPDLADLDLAEPLPRVLIAHGTEDDSVPVEHARHARSVLSAAGATVVYLETPVGHLIDQDVIPRVRAFVAGAALDHTR